MLASKQVAQNVATFEHVDKSFVTPASTVPVLHDISFQIPFGSFTILHGPSGSGKSTVLNTLIGLEPPTAGKVIVDNQDIYALSNDERAKFRAKTIGMVHQDNYWVNSLSVLDNVALPLLLAGWAKHKALFLAEQSIVRVGLGEYLHYNPTVLSGGQQQRISFARATVIKPKILVADEPTGNLDSVSGERIIELLKDFNNNYGATIVLVTHNDSLLEISNNRLDIKDGRLQTLSSDPAQKTKKQVKI